MTLPASPSLYRPAEVVNTDDTLPSWRPVAPLLNAAVGQDYYSILNFGSRFPIYGPPRDLCCGSARGASDFSVGPTSQTVSESA